jgi:hypothetical protein
MFGPVYSVLFLFFIETKHQNINLLQISLKKKLFGIKLNKNTNNNNNIKKSI